MRLGNITKIVIGWWV